MQTVAAQLTPAQITALGTYYGSLPKRGLNTVQPPADVLARGSAIAANGAANGSISACNACHGSVAPGSGIPAIAGQNLDYVRTQLRLFRSGERKDPRTFNPMPAEAHALTDAELDDVARYFAAQPVAPAAAAAVTAPAAPVARPAA
jgi:cytochrome c553